MTDYRIKWDSDINRLRYQCTDGEPADEKWAHRVLWNNTANKLQTTVSCTEDSFWDDAVDVLEIRDTVAACCAPPQCYRGQAGNGCLSCCDDLAFNGTLTVAGTGACNGTWGIDNDPERCGWYGMATGGTALYVDLCWLSAAGANRGTRIHSGPGIPTCDPNFDLKLGQCAASAGPPPDLGDYCRRAGSATDGTVSVEWSIPLA